MAKKSRIPKENTSPDSDSPGGGRGRPLWSGSISWGLINIPVRLLPGLRRNDVRFHLLHDKDKARLQEKLYCPVDQEEVSRQDVVKGYEVSKDQHVIVSQEEINSLAPKASRTIELLSVVDVAQIDPIYFDRPFYLVPDEPGAKAYLLLVEALGKLKKGAIAKFVMRNKEYIGAIRPIKRVLCMDTLHFANEVIGVNEISWKPPTLQLRDAEVKMALQLLESLESGFDPKQLHDDYREALLQLIHRKAEGEEIVATPQADEEAPQVIDLMEALRKSVAEVQKHKGRKVA